MALRNTALLLSLLLAAPPLASAEEERRAQPRSGSSGGSSARSSGAQHRSPSSSVSSSSRSGGSHRSSGSAVRSQGRSQGRSQVRPTTGAQRRQPRPGTGSLYRGGRYYGSRPYRYLGRTYYSGYWPSHYFGYYSRPWYFGPGYRLSMAGGYPYLYGYSYYPYYGGYGSYGYYAPHTTYVTPVDTETVGVRVMVDPVEARVYVDGAYAGEADDFDGLFQRLYLEPGEHELMFELEGHRSHVLVLDVAPGASLKVRHTMQEGSGQPTVDDRTRGRAVAALESERARRDPAGAPASEPAPLSERDRAYERPEAAASAQLRLNVSPEDASVYVDGEFRGTGGALEGRALELGPGAHRVEVVHPGFAAASREVTLEGGETRELSVELGEP